MRELRRLVKKCDEYTYANMLTADEEFIVLKAITSAQSNLTPQSRTLLVHQFINNLVTVDCVLDIIVNYR